MRRALLLATALVAPALVRAQTQPSAGQILFVNTDSDLNAAKINTVECSTAARVQLAFAPTTVPGSDPRYQLFASNKDTASTSVFTGLNATTACPIESDGTANNGATVVRVGDQLVNPPSLVDVTFSTSTIASALGSAPCAGTGETPIYLCMQALSGTTKVGTARATITLSLVRPDVTPQFNLPVSPGNTRLTPSWSPGGTATTKFFQVQAVSLQDPTHLPSVGIFDPASGFNGFDGRDTARHGSSFVSGDRVTVGGLQNDVIYALLVRGYTDAYNPGDPSTVVTASPQVVRDFWDTYKADGGRETGGCASGAAGPLGLLLLAGALSLVRRRK